MSEGLALVAAMHITAGVWINDDEPGLQEDTLEWLDKVAPPSWKEPANDVARQLLPDPGDYRHHRGGEDNGDAHLKNLLVHHQAIVPVTDGPARPRPLAAGLLHEFDGRPPEAARDQGDRGVGPLSHFRWADASEGEPIVSGRWACAPAGIHRPGPETDPSGNARRRRPRMNRAAAIAMPSVDGVS